MADQKVTELDAVTSLADTDLFGAVVDPAGSPVSNKIVASNALRLAHGSISLTSGSTPQALGAAAFELLTGWGASVSGINVTASHGDSKITLANAGTYKVDASALYAMAAAETVRLAFFWNSVQQGPYVEWANTSTENVQLFHAWQFYAGVAAQDLELHVYSASGEDITLKEAGMTVHRVG